MKKESLKSFVELCERRCIHKIVLVEYFPQFAESGSTDAYEWYVSKGFHNLNEPISDLKIASWIHKAIIEKVDVVGYCMKKSNGTLNPLNIIEIYKTYFEN
jgi:hypothetical protein